jgi:hypothetical protein
MGAEAWQHPYTLFCFELPASPRENKRVFSSSPQCILSGFQWSPHLCLCHSHPFMVGVLVIALSLDSKLLEQKSGGEHSLQG